MANNDFDSFDDFNSSFDDFDFNSSSDDNMFSGSNDFGGDDFGGSDDFGNDSGFSGNSSRRPINNRNNTDSNNNDDDADFSQLSFSDTSSSGSGESNNGGQSQTKKSAIILIVIGIILVLAVLLGVRIFTKNKDASENNNQTTVVNTTTTNTEIQNTQRNDINVDNIVSSGNVDKNAQVGKKDGWTEITNSEKVEFYTELKELVFTVTEVKHYAKTTDNVLLVETRVKGSLSGMSGTYELKIPYNKGVLLNVGNEFTVYVLIGNFNGKTVVGDIKY